MSAKKSPLSVKEYVDIVAKQGRAADKLAERFLKLLSAGASMPEYGALFLEYVNRFRSDGEKIVAMVNIFILGVTVGKKNSDKVEESEPTKEEKIASMIEGLRKSGKMPKS